MLYTNLTSAKLLEKIKDLKGLHSVTVDHNPFGEGGKQTLISHTLQNGELSTYNLGQNNIDGIDYAYNYWTDGSYKGTFDLETTPFQCIKPEVYKVGDTIRILENARECGCYNHWHADKKEMIGKVLKIYTVLDSVYGVSYDIQEEGKCAYVFPGYCIQKIELEPKTEPKTIKIGNETYTVTPELITALSNFKKI